jgi:chemotaxis protein histidine kinase CheA
VQSNNLSAYKSAFISAVKEHLEKLTILTETLTNQSVTEDLLKEMYLHLHSLKGESNVMGYRNISESCEKGLIFLKELKKDTPSSYIVQIISPLIITLQHAIEGIEEEIAVPINS